MGNSNNQIIYSLTYTVLNIEIKMYETSQVIKMIRNKQGKQLIGIDSQVNEILEVSYMNFKIIVINIVKKIRCQDGEFHMRTSFSAFRSLMKHREKAMQNVSLFLYNLLNSRILVPQVLVVFVALNSVCLFRLARILKVQAAAFC